MTQRRACTALLAVLLGATLGLAQPVSSTTETGDRAAAPVRTTITADDLQDPTTLDVIILGTIAAGDRRCVRQRLVRVTGFDPIAGEVVKLGTDRADRRGDYSVTFDLQRPLDGRYTVAVTRQRIAGQRPVLCGAAKVRGNYLFD